MQDVIADEAERWDLIARCDINRHWSALVGVVPGNLRLRQRGPRDEYD